MLDEALRPSAEAEAVLRAAGWSPSRTVDISTWAESLRRDGNEVFPVAESILRSFGGLAVRRRETDGLPGESFDVDPSHWIGLHDVVADAEQALRHRLVPLGALSGDTMLAVLDDGRIVSEFQGYVDLLGRDWSSALDRLTLGKGDIVPLVRDYVSVDDAFR